MRRPVTPPLRRLVAAVLAGTCLAVLLPSFAADPATPAAKPATKPAAKVDAKPRDAVMGKGTGPVMSRDELRRCMTEDDRLKKETAGVLEAQVAMKKSRSEIDRLGSELEVEKASVDRTNQAAVDAFNEKVKTRGKIISDYSAAAPLFNERIDKLAADQEAYAKECGDRKYLESDYNDIKAGK